MFPPEMTLYVSCETPCGTERAFCNRDVSVDSRATSDIHKGL
jgi:hypothetical protein